MEKKYVPEGVFLTCDKGTIPCQLSVTFNADTVIYGQNLATEADKITGVHVKPMGMCAATQGPCVPAPLTWSPLQNDVLVGGNRLLLEDSKLQCSLSGRISIFFSMAAAQAACATVPPEKSLLDQADDYLATLGPAGDYMRFQMGMAEGLFEGGKSMAEGLWGLAKGGWHAATHPIATAEAVGGAASSAWNWASKGDNWSNAASAAGQGIGNAADWASHGDNWGKAWDGASDWASKQSPRDWGKIGGRATFEVAMAVGTGGAGEALNVAGKAGEVANLASKAGEVANLAEKGGQALNLTEKGLEAANIAEKVGEASNAAGKAEVLGKVTNGAEEAVDASRAAREAEEASQAAKTGETVEGAAKDKRTCPEDPIDVATGAMLFDAVDIELPGPIPFVWERTWYSNSTHQGPLGHGWHHRYDQVLWLGSTGAVHLRLADGRLATFEPLGADNGFYAYHRAEQLELRHDPQQPDGYQVFNLRERLTYYFAPVAATTSEPTFCLLQAVSNAHGQSLQFTYTEQGYLQGIKDSAQRALEVLTDATGRIIAINLPLPEGIPGTFAAVQYTYDELGNMTAAIDAEGYAARYDYEGNLLVRKTFREGTSFYFEYNAQARCTRTWGDENYYNGSFFYAEGHTVLLNEEPSARHEYFHQNGLVTRYIDPVGAIHEWYYNQYNELELARDPLGQTTTYDYDARGNQVGISYSAGTRVGLNYDAHNLLVAATDITGGTWKWEHDEQGNLLRAQNPVGAVTEYSYDQDGRLVTITDALRHATHLRYDSQQNVAHIVTPDGHIRSRTYDALGRSVILTDALGYQQHRRYDRLGRLVALQEPDGRQVSLAYDGEGNVVRAQDGQQEVEFAYTAVKRLARRRQAGQEIQFTYDREGRLVQLLNEHNLPYRFTLDAAGRVVAEEGFDGLRRTYDRDAAGRVITVHRPAGRTTRYTYHADGQVSSTAHNDEAPTTYEYDGAGALVAAHTAATSVRFERDALGRVTREQQGTHTVDYEYDARGQRTCLRSSLGADFTWQHDVMGNLMAVQAGGHWQARLQHDARGLEVQRQLSGGVQQSWQYDALGRPTRQQVQARGGARQRTYYWRGTDQLTAIDDSLASTTHYTYDALGALTGARYPDGQEELRLADAVGNLFRTPTLNDRTYNAGGQLRTANGTHYHYDAEGNLLRKTAATGQQWHYSWDGAGQLVSVRLPNGYQVTFTYDALGRRVAKRYRGRVSRWVWAGDVPLHEWQELEIGAETGSIQDLSTWLFEENSFVPTAKLTKQGAYSVVADHLGTPLALYDEQGRPTWTMTLDSYGAVRHGQGKPQDCPFRYQGQYEDTETGLYYNRLRYYDPEGGQYISQDPIRLGGGENLYGYVSNPTSWLDPLGLAKTPTSTLRRIWREYSGTASTGQVHHGLPEQLASEYKSLANIEVNSGEYFFDLTPEQHIRLPDGIHTKGSPLGQEWNAHWRDWLDTNRSTLQGSSKAQAKQLIEQKLDEMAAKAGIAPHRAKKKIVSPCTSI